LTIVGESALTTEPVTVKLLKDQTAKVSALNLYLVLYLGGTQLFLTFVVDPHWFNTSVMKIYAGVGNDDARRKFAAVECFLLKPHKQNPLGKRAKEFWGKRIGL